MMMMTEMARKVIDRQHMRRAGGFLKSFLSVKITAIKNRLKGLMRENTGTVAVVVGRIASRISFSFLLLPKNG